MNKFFLGILITLSSLTASAQSQPVIYGYDFWALKASRDYLDLITDNAAPSPGSSACTNVYSASINKGVIDIRYALGFFDDSQGQDILWNGFNYGRSPSLDPAIYDVLRQVLLDECIPGRALCGFEEIGDPSTGKTIFEKSMHLFGREILARVTLTRASVTDSFVMNTQTWREQQQQFTRQAEENFFGGLKRADFVFYNGHSRNGGGPDFNPPVLNSDGHPDYDGYYLVNKPGLRKVLNSIPSNPNQKVFLGMFSCYSHMKFYDVLHSTFPNLRMVLSINTIDYFDALKGSLGYLEGILEGRCGDDLSHMARQTPGVQNGFRDYNFH